MKATSAITTGQCISLRAYNCTGFCPGYCEWWLRFGKEGYPVLPWTVCSILGKTLHPMLAQSAVSPRFIEKIEPTRARTSHTDFGKRVVQCCSGQSTVFLGKHCIPCQRYHLVSSKELNQLELGLLTPTLDTQSLHCQSKNEPVLLPLLGTITLVHHSYCQELRGQKALSPDTHASCVCVCMCVCLSAPCT